MTGSGAPAGRPGPLRYDHVLLDLDGAVYVGPAPVPGVPAALARLRAAGVGIAFVTNDPVSARADYVRRLAGMGIAAAAHELVTAAWATAQLIADERPRSRVLALGSAAYAHEHAALGLELVDDPAAAQVVSVGGDDGFGYAELRAAVLAAAHGAHLYGANRDRTFPTAAGPAPATGAMVAALEYAAARPVRVAGKPEPTMLHEAARLLGPGRCLMVGDRLDADIAAAAAAGMDSALVLTGSTAAAEVEPWDGAPPTHVLASAAGLPELLGLA